MEKMEKIKVLYFVDRLRHGGIQQLIVEILRNVDTKKVQIDLLVFDDGETYPLEEVVKNLGVQLFKINAWIRTPLDYIKQAKALNKFFSEHHDYKAVHMHSSSKNFMVLKYAKKYGIKIRIPHSHNIGFQSKNKIKILVGDILKKPLKKYATHYFACSELAGKWLFGNEKVKIIHNAVDYKRFKFNLEKRDELRKGLGIENKLVVGNVGRFTTQKNHTFLIDIFNEIHKQNEDTILMLVGIGEKEDEIKKKVQDLNLQDCVKFMGFCKNTNEMMWCMDMFLMPSLHEGLPVVGVEAQCTGLPCFMSKDVITKEIKIASNVQFISLENTSKEWADIILKSDLERKDNYKELKEAGYFIEQTVDELEKFYIDRKSVV